MRQAVLCLAGAIAICWVALALRPEREDKPAAKTMRSESAGREIASVETEINPSRPRLCEEFSTGLLTPRSRSFFSVSFSFTTGSYRFSETTRVPSVICPRRDSAGR